jgi:hypothetical protein
MFSHRHSAYIFYQLTADARICSSFASLDPRSYILLLTHRLAFLDLLPPHSQFPSRRSTSNLFCFRSEPQHRSLCRANKTTSRSLQGAWQYGLAKYRQSIADPSFGELVITKRSSYAGYCLTQWSNGWEAPAFVLAHQPLYGRSVRLFRKLSEKKTTSR